MIAQHLTTVSYRKQSSSWAVGGRGCGRTLQPMTVCNSYSPCMSTFSNMISSFISRVFQEHLSLDIHRGTLFNNVSFIDCLSFSVLSLHTLTDIFWDHYQDRLYTLKSLTQVGFWKIPNKERKFTYIKLYITKLLCIYNIFIYGCVCVKQIYKLL